MSESPNLQDVQKRTLRLVNFEDGLWDLLLGGIFLLLAVYPVTRELIGPTWNLALFLGILGVFVLAQLYLRRVVSGPRLGYVRPRQTQKTRVLRIVVIAFVLLTLILVLVTLLSPEDAPATPLLERSYLVEWIVVLAIGTIFSAMGYIFGVTRVYFYGWMLGFANLASVYLSHNAGWTFLVPLATAAVIIILIGVTLLVRFLGNYPVRTQEA
jgi:hypothetical protein